MNSKECNKCCVYEHECDFNNGLCPEDREVEMRKETEQNNQKVFGSWFEEYRLEFVNEYRKLEHLSYVLADGEDSPFDLLLNTLESYFPAYEWEQVHDNNDEINDTYYELIEMSRNKDVTNKEFHDRIIRRNF